MEVKSISYSTLLHVLSYRSQVKDKKEYLVVKTPHNPGYFWGNFLFFYKAPGKNALGLIRSLWICRLSTKPLPGIQSIMLLTK